MDPRFVVSREELYNLQMEVKQVQVLQTNHADRILRLEKRQADDAALKSVWNSPFPSVLGGTPQQGPVRMPSNGDFDAFDEQGEHLLSSLHLSAAEDEPTRRGGAASRANSVRFDESALQGAAGWSSQNNRHSGEFGPIRPGSGLMMERSLSHKSDGRHSSAGHSVHSVHSAASGRGSSLGLDTNFMVGHDDESPIDMPEPPPGFYVLGSVPSIIRCWLTTNFAHKTLLYADVCTGSQKSTLDFSLAKELDLLQEAHLDPDGVFRIRLPVFLAEALVAQANTRSASPGHQIPSIVATFEIVGIDLPEPAEAKPNIRIFIGSDTLRAHSADILFSQNHMTIYSQDRDKLTVPFVTPEDDAVFRHICTATVVPEKPKLNATATPFVLDRGREPAPPPVAVDSSTSQAEEVESPEPVSPRANHAGGVIKAIDSNVSESGTESDRVKDTGSSGDAGVTKETPQAPSSVSGSDSGRRESGTGIWGSWRGGQANGDGTGQRENGLLSGYQPAGRPARTMKVLKSQKASSSNSARTGAAYEPPPPPRSSNEYRRKSVAGENGGLLQTGPSRWEAKRTPSSSSETKPQSQAPSQPPVSIPSNSSQTPSRETRDTRETRNPSSAGLPRSANPVGGASAFSWMNPQGKGKPATTAE